MGGDRESRKWNSLREKLLKKGLPVKTIYGKGGLIRSGLHYAFVINNKYLIVIYSSSKTAGQHRSWLYKKIEDILRVAMSTKQKEPEKTDVEQGGIGVKDVSPEQPGVESALEKAREADDEGWGPWSLEENILDKIFNLINEIKEEDNSNVAHDTLQ